MMMDYREETFKRKFGDAAVQLGVAADQVVSVKLRENVASYSEYADLVMWLEQEAGLSLRDVKGDFQGQAHLLDDHLSKVILVEHETGLEILFVSASIASLISLVPVVMQAWRWIRGRSSRMHRSQDAELRRLDKDGHLQEDHVDESFAYPLHMSVVMMANLTEHRFAELVEKMDSLTSRMNALEERLQSPSEAGRHSAGDKKPTESRRGRTRGS